VENHGTRNTPFRSFPPIITSCLHDDDHLDNRNIRITIANLYVILDSVSIVKMNVTDASISQAVTVTTMSTTTTATATTTTTTVPVAATFTFTLLPFPALFCVVPLLLMMLIVSIGGNLMVLLSYTRDSMMVLYNQRSFINKISNNRISGTPFFF
jgi:hypothetical protein